MNDYNMYEARQSYNDARNLFESRSEKDCVFAIELLDRDVCLELLQTDVRDKKLSTFFLCSGAPCKYLALSTHIQQG